MNNSKAQAGHYVYRIAVMNELTTINIIEKKVGCLHVPNNNNNNNK